MMIWRRGVYAWCRYICPVNSQVRWRRRTGARLSRLGFRGVSVVDTRRSPTTVMRWCAPRVLNSAGSEC